MEARSYLLLEMELAKPLVPKRPASVIANRWVYSLIGKYMYSVHVHVLCKYHKDTAIFTCSIRNKATPI